MSSIKPAEFNYYRKTEGILYNYTSLRASVNNLQGQLAEMEGDISVSAIDYRKPAVQSSYTGSEVEAIVAARDKRRTMLTRRLRKTERLVEAVDKAIAALEDQEQVIITQRYLNGSPWYAICHKVRYNERWCREIRKRAVGKVALALFGADI